VDSDLIEATRALGARQGELDGLGLNGLNGWSEWHHAGAAPSVRVNDPR
jgi:hypothetical protein